MRGHDEVIGAANQASIDKWKEFEGFVEALSDEDLILLLRRNMETFKETIVGSDDDRKIDPQYLWWMIYDYSTQKRNLPARPTPPLNRAPDEPSATELLKRQYSTLMTHEREEFRQEFFELDDNEKNECLKNQDFNSLKRLLQSLGILSSRTQNQEDKIKYDSDSELVLTHMNKDLLAQQFESLSITSGGYIDISLKTRFIAQLADQADEEKDKVLERQSEGSLADLITSLDALLKKEPSRNNAETEALKAQSKIILNQKRSTSPSSVDKTSANHTPQNPAADPSTELPPPILPVYANVEDSHKNNMKKFIQEIQAHIKTLPISSKDKQFILEEMIKLKANLEALALKTPRNESEEAVLTTGRALLEQCTRTLKQGEFKASLQHPENLADFKTMLASSATLASNPNMPNQDSLNALIQAASSEKKSFTPIWDGVRTAAKYFAIAIGVCAIIAALGAITWATCGLAIPLLLPALAPVVAPAAVFLASAGTTIATVATASAATVAAGATVGAGIVGATATTTAATTIGLAAAHPVLATVAGAGIGVTAVGVGAKRHFDNKAKRDAQKETYVSFGKDGLADKSEKFRVAIEKNKPKPEDTDESKTNTQPISPRQ